MRTNVFVAVAGCVVLGISGCGWFGGKDAAEEKGGKPEAGRVAIVDLDEVARRLGRDQYMLSALKQSQQTLNEQLQVAQASYVKQIEAKQEKLGLGQEGVEIPDDEAKKLLEMRRNAGLYLNQARKQGISRLNKERTQLIQDFRELVKPVAREVASEGGLSIVLVKNDAILFVHEDAVDITDEVALRLKDNGAGIATHTAQQPATQSSSQATQQR